MYFILIMNSARKGQKVSEELKLQYIPQNFSLSLSLSHTHTHTHSHVLTHLKTFAFDHCFWSMDPKNRKFASK